MTYRKGVTPVIAVVLLLLLTIGLVGVLWTQAEDLMDIGGEAAFLEDVDIEINTVLRSDEHPGEEETMELRLENTGDSEYNLSDIARIEYSIPGESSLEPEDADAGFNEVSYIGQDDLDDSDAYCMDPESENMSSFGPDDGTQTCDTAVEVPSPDESVTVELVEDGSGDTITSYTCSPSTSDSPTC